MKFSLLHLLGFIVCVSVALTLAQSAGHLSMPAIVAIVITPAYFLLNIEHWRQITYGGLLGILLLWLMANVATYTLHMHLPRPPIRSGYDTGIPLEQTEFANRISPFIVPIGFLLGATGLIVYSKHWRTRELAVVETEMQKRHQCGRMLAVTTLICSRCETRLDTSPENAG